jgi:hypothetical protein
LEDVIIGKLTAWSKGRSRRHETDIYDMMAHHYLGLGQELIPVFNETNIDRQAEKLGSDTTKLWEAIKTAAKKAASEEKNNCMPITPSDDFCIPSPCAANTLYVHKTMLD